MSDVPLSPPESIEEVISPEISNEAPPAPAPDQRQATVEAVRTSRSVPPGLRERLSTLAQQTPALDAAGEPLLATRQVLDLLAQGLPPVLRTEPTAAAQRPVHPAGDVFFAVNGDELSDQQADEIARTQLERAGLLRSA
jgi:hypothetical protein